VVRGDDDAAEVRHVVFVRVLLIDVQHVRRSRDQRLHVVVELVAVEVTEIACLAHA
jgi:hypothetical protein